MGSFKNNTERLIFQQIYISIYSILLLVLLLPLGSAKVIWNLNPSNINSLMQNTYGFTLSTLLEVCI